MANSERILNTNIELQECVDMAKMLPNKPTITALSVNENGVYTPDNGVGGFAPVIVDVRDTNFADLITNNLTTVDSDVTSIRQYAFRGATKLKSVNLPNATTIGSNAFYACSVLESVNMPKVETLSDNVFNSCGKLASISLPSLTTSGTYTFRSCPVMLTADLGKLTSIPAGLFYYSYRLRTVILRSETLCTLANTNAFANCYHLTGTQNNSYNPNGDKDCYIYVPRALIEDYKVATNWSTYETQFRALEDYTIDGTITGEFDINKI